MSEDFDPDHPALFLRSAFEGDGWKWACGQRQFRIGDKAWHKRRANKIARKAAKNVLNGDRGRLRKVPGNGYDVV